jgi:hypothetical protein
MENFLNLAELALMAGRNPMTVGGMDILPISALALTLVLLGLRMANKKSVTMAESFQSARSGGFFEKQRMPAQKKCPHCAMQLPLSAIICETCDYNFLAERPGRGQKLLALPEEASEPERPIYDLTVADREDLPSV